MNELLQNERHYKILGWILTVTLSGHSVLRKGNRAIWQIKEGWQVADLVRGYYDNHRPEKTLVEALDKNSYTLVAPRRCGTCSKLFTPQTNGVYECSTGCYYYQHGLWGCD